ncbi:Kinesin-like protein kif21b [Apophysomyces sp. BC1034]|nr:Kinesin-like protein kif21b [Apophysomyces sp. BC1015]KAG0176875.1 Kinesin-like protein kif21b [Apophysomyces sp. BC1021]KAG0187136.1 Kinesin-like protein kif21b [Apophysomyces sp. BC1034]
MGTGQGPMTDLDQQGIIHRFASSLFEQLEQTHGHSENAYQVYISFLELHNEDINDLLVQQNSQKDVDDHPSIREDNQGRIYWTGVREERVYNPQELLGFLTKGALCRTTGSTEMNASSSRSHAIFTVVLKQQIMDEGGSNSNEGSVGAYTKRFVSKFHFVDLAGSERLKRTNAQGDRQKEGISINTGLLALGNVISALGDESRKGPHVPYRDSKLTRLLQDSLGGNSHTLMLACVSPCELDYLETLNTLKYANRARNIQNRVQINHDYEGSPEELDHLRDQVSQLKKQISILREVHNTPAEDELQTLKDQLAQMHRDAQQASKEFAKVQSERDTLIVRMNPNEPDRNTDEQIYAHPLIRQYTEIIQNLKLEVKEARSRLAYAGQQPDSPKAHASNSASLPGRYGTFFRRSIDSTFLSDKLSRVGSTSSGRRQKLKHVPVALRMKTLSATRKKSILLGSPRSPLRNDFVSHGSIEDLLNVLCQERTGLAEDIHNDSVTFGEWTLTNDKESNMSAYANNVLFMSQSQDETGDMSHTKSRLASDHQGQLDLSKDFPIDQRKPTEMLPDSPISPANLSTQPVDTEHHEDDDDDLEALTVPTWTDAPKTQSTNGSTKRESLSWTDSLLDDSDNSVATSRLTSSWTTTATRSRDGRRRSKDLLKMLHQVQADILVKKELVGQLEKSEDEYAQMRINYEEKLTQLQEHLSEMQRERDLALRKTSTARPQGVLQLREARQAQEVRSLYEVKMKRLVSENQELRRKYTQATNSMQTARTKAEGLITRLRSNIESLKLEKKQIQKTTKQEADKAREAVATSEREAQQFKRRELAAIDARKKVEETCEGQAQFIKKRNDEMAAMNTHMRQLVNALRKAATEGILLNEAALDKIMTGAKASVRSAE